MKMEKKIYAFLIFLLYVLLISSNTPSARLLGYEEEKRATWGTTQADLSAEMSEELSTLMGLEECNDKGEECMKRRMTIEAHLDYIYTQNHKP